MNPTIFDYRLQMLNCPSCGAPLVTSREGGLVHCTYCSAASVINARVTAPRAGRRSSLAEETARLSRLKAQLEHPVVGHFYDLTRPPAGLEQWAPRSVADVELLFGEWSRAVDAPLTERPEMQRRICWIASRVTSLASAPDPLRTRALLDKTLGWLNDEGYRHLIRCRLAQAAIEANELDAAEGWLTECDWAPEVIELDSASRLIRAWLAARRRSAEEVLELLGDEGAHLPIVASQQDEAQRLRVDAFELLGRNDAAYRGFFFLAKKNGLVVESERFALANLALDTVRAALCHGLAEMTRQRSVKLRTQITELARRREQVTAMSSTKPLRRLPLHAMVLAFAVWLVRCSYDVDPLGGTYGYVLCPKICAECRGPTRTVTEWISTGPGESSTNGPQYFCQGPDRRVMEMSAQELKRNIGELSGQELGAASAFFASYAALLVGLLPLGVIRSLRKGSRDRVEYQALSLQVSKLARKLGEAAPQAPSDLGASLRSTALVWGVAVLTAALLAWWTA